MTDPNEVALARLGVKGATEEEVGAALHEWSGFHPATVVCTGCPTIGRARLQMLSDLGLARRRRDGLWLRKKDPVSNEGAVDG